MADPTKHPHSHGHEGNPHEHGAHKPGADDNPHVSYERKDINIVQITGFGIGLLIACMVTVFAMWGLFEYFKQREDKVNPPNPPSMMSEKQKEPPEPRLQVEPVIELKKMRDNEEMLLTSYGWMDSARGTVRIPIDQAIDMVAAKGLPVKLSPVGGEHDGYRMLPSDASGGKTLEKISQ